MSNTIAADCHENTRKGAYMMAKAKAAARERRAYEYDHHYGLSLNARRGGQKSPAAAAGEASSRPAKATKSK
jgi:hypothetical protein